MDLLRFEDLQTLNTESNWDLILQYGMGVTEPYADRLLQAYMIFIRCAPRTPTRDIFYQCIFSRIGFLQSVSVEEMIDDTKLLIEQRKSSFSPTKEGEPDTFLEREECEYCKECRI